MFSSSIEVEHLRGVAAYHLVLVLARQGPKQCVQSCLRFKPDGPEVMKAYQQALGLSPADVGLRLEYAAALEKLGDKDFAKDQYREALQWDDLLPKDEPKRLTENKRKEIEALIKR